ncbi:pogo transposable element with ZNF domain isoform X4 [Halichoeres trimaculatus]|uniref:pogo transposable element with ZNF domain isoform X4 n=1 Tax=Halichoeres trimaculatus TaxID=147232 RepID=UPI003D9E366C
MVRQCVFPLCPNKMTTSSKFSFHRLPLDYPALLKVWLVALKMDPNTEIEDLKRASHRVCSAHFAPEDFIRTKPKKKGQEPQRQNLKRSAIPTVSEGATDAAEVMEEVKEVEPTEGTEGAELLMLCDEDEMEVFPQEMEREEKEETKGGHNREETTNLAAVESMENARMGQVSVQPESSSTQGNTLNTTQKDTLNNTSNNREKGAPLGFKVNGRLVSLQPGGGAAELKLSSYPRGSASGFTKVQVSIHPSFQQPAETDASTASAQTGADFTPIITGVVSGEAAQRVLSDHSTNIPLTERNSQPRASNLTSQETSCTSRRPQEKGQLGPSPPDCLACRSQYQFIPKLRGFMCLCSPAIALSLKNLEDKRRRSSHRRSRDKNRNSRSYRDSQTFKPPRTLSRPEPPAQSQCEASQSKLVILVDDFYYGSAPGRLSTNNETGGENCGPYQCSQCQSTLHNNIELMNHMKFHITKPQLDRRRDSLTLCPHCFRHFTSPLSLQCHLEAVHNQCKPSALCKICELAFSTEAIFLSHMKSTHKPGEMPYTCQVCDFRSSFYADVWSHFESHHADSEHLLCPFCLRVMNSSMSYQQHVGRHQRKHVFGCERCRLHFLYDNEQIQHDLIHHRTYVKPAQLTGLRPGTKVTVRTYSVVRPAEAKEGLNKTSPSKAVDLEPPPPRQGALKRKLVESLGGLLSSLSQESTSDGVSDPSPLCVECMSSVHDFKTHFPSVVRCSVCSFLTCCCTAYANHMISNHAVQTTAPEYANIFQSRPRLSEKLECVSCTFSTHRGDIMANHLTERPEHRCVMLLNGLSAYSAKRRRTRDGAFIPLHLIPSSRQIGDKLSVKFLSGPFALSAPPAMSINFLGPPREQVRVSPLTSAKLSVVLSALCHGIAQASLHHRTSPHTIRAWIALQEQRLSSSKWPWSTEKLAEWVLSQREQQLQVSQEDLLRAARSALGDSSQQVDQICWSVDFLLRHRLDFNLTNIDDFKYQLTLLRSLREKSLSFIKRLANQIHSCPVPPRRFGSMDEFSIFIDPVQLYANSLLAFQLSCSSTTDKPVFDVVLSALSDGTFLPPLLFFKGNPSPVPKGFPDNVILEARPEGFTEQERHKIWIKKVWSPHVASQGGESLLMVDVHRGHLSDEFRSSLSSLTTDVVFIPSGCSCCLQPLDVCVTPVLRDFLQARWIHLVSDGDLDGLGLEGLALTLACWFSEICSTLNTETQILLRSFALACKEVENRGEEASLIQTFTEALCQPLETPKPEPTVDPGPEPELELLLVLEEEKNETEKIQETRMEVERRWMKVELVEEEEKKEVLMSPSALCQVFEGGSDQESFNRFDGV